MVQPGTWIERYVKFYIAKLRLKKECGKEIGKSLGIEPRALAWAASTCSNHLSMSYDHPWLPALSLPLSSTVWWYSRLTPNSHQYVPSEHLPVSTSNNSPSGEEPHWWILKSQHQLLNLCEIKTHQCGSSQATWVWFTAGFFSTFLFQSEFRIWHLSSYW